MSIFAKRNHIKNNINKKNVIVEPHWNENYEPIPFYPLIKPQNQQDQEYKQIKPSKQGTM